jgi:hypothetical protein
MNTYSTLFVVLMFTAVVLIMGTMILTVLKNLQRSRFPQWTFLDYVSVGHAKHLYTKYILRK